MLRNRLDIHAPERLSNFSCLQLVAKPLDPLDPLCTPPWNPWNIQPSQGTGQGVSMTFNAASRPRSLEDRSAARGSSRCELPGMHSVPKSAVLPYASGVGGLSRRSKIGQRPTLLPPATALALLWGKRPCRRPRFIGPPFLPGRSWDAQLPETRFCRKTPPQERISSAPGRPPKSIMSTILPNTPFPKSKERMLGCWGGT